jgi:hypothetical protein
MSEAIPSLPQYAFMAWYSVEKMHRDNFTYYLFITNRDSSVSIATRLRTGRPGFDSRQRLAIFLLTTASRPVLEPTQPPIQWVPWALSLGVKRLGREADNLPPSSAEVKNAWSYTSTLPYVFM